MMSSFRKNSWWRNFRSNTPKESFNE